MVYTENVECLNGAIFHVINIIENAQKMVLNLEESVDDKPNLKTIIGYVKNFLDEAKEMACTLEFVLENHDTASPKKLTFEDLENRRMILQTSRSFIGGLKDEEASEEDKKKTVNNLKSFITYLKEALADSDGHHSEPDSHDC